MQRVLFVVGDHYSERFDPRILGQAKIFMLKGWDVTILCTSNSTKNEKIVKENIRFILVNSQNRFLFSHAIHTKFLKFKNYRFLRKIVLKLKFECAKIGQIVFPKIIESPKNELRYLLKIKRIADMDFDLVVACDMSAYLTSKKISNKEQSILWLDLHEYFSEQSLSELRKIRYKMLEKEAVLNVDRIFTVNHMLAEKISNDLKLPIQSVDWIPNAALPDRGQGKSNEYFRTFLAKYNRAILYNGSIVPDRNLDKVPELARHLEKYGIAVVVVGPGDFRAFSHIEVDNFFVLPALMPESMNSALKYFDAILFPNEPLNLNTQYCYPNKLGDALHAGLSLIVNEGLVFLESLVRAYEIGTIIDMKNLEKASVEIAKLLFSNHLGNRVEEANRAYGWNTFSTKYSAWIDRLPVNGEDIYPDIY